MRYVIASVIIFLLEILVIYSFKQGFLSLKLTMFLLTVCILAAYTLLKKGGII